MQSQQINQEYRQIIHRLEEKENTINDLRTQIRRLNKICNSIKQC